MKKIALTSLLAVFAISGAHAANVIDGNPLYMPAQNHFYSVTALSSHSEDADSYVLSEDFGYGVLDNLAINVKAGMFEGDAFDVYGMGDLALGATFRALDMGDWKLDLFGEYATAGDEELTFSPSIFAATKDDTYWFDKELVNYKWTAGIRGGYTTSVFTVAGRVEFAYTNTESFNWGDEGMHTWTFGLDGQYVINDDWNLVGTVEYTGVSDDEAKNAGRWFGEFGVNYNIDATKFVGAYINGGLYHQDGDSHDKWGWEEGFGFGAKFGIDF